MNLTPRTLQKIDGMDEKHTSGKYARLIYSTCTGLEDTYFLYQCLKILTWLPPKNNTTKISSQ